MRLLGTADLHGGLTRYGVQTATGNSRLDDFEKTLDAFVTYAVENSVDIAAFAGDTFDTRREGPRERAIFAKALYRLTSHDIAVVVVPGNHDGTTTVGDPGTHSFRWLSALNIENVFVATGFARGVVIRTPAGPLNLTALPYPHKRAFDSELESLTPEERVLEAGRRLDRALLEVGNGLDLEPNHRTAPRLFVGHLTVGGATAGAEATMSLSWDVAISPEAIEPWDFALLGHIHNQQQVGPRAWYAGSPQFLDFSAVGQTKGFLDVTFGRGEEPVVTVVDSHPRPMVDVEVSIQEDGSDRYSVSDIPPGGAIVRAIVRADRRPNTARLASLISAMRKPDFGGASYVKLHVITPERPAQQRIAVTATDDVLTATAQWLTANGHELDPTMDAARRLVTEAGGPA